MGLSRRQFIGAGAAVTSVVAGFAGLRHLSRSAGPAVPPTPLPLGYGGLDPDPGGILDLPPGFTYRVFSRTGDPMDDGFLVPGAHDGMAAFSGPGGTTIVVRNHELTPRNAEIGPFGPDGALRSRLDPSALYDWDCQGGTTTFIYDTRAQRLERQFLSLAGTIRNCAGGPTPWGSWVSCEEAADQAGGNLAVEHGYTFEVPCTAVGPVLPVPLRDMGRFNHEAIAVDVASGVVYETEDRPDGLFYRFLPNARGQLARGGRLQALRILDLDVSTSNPPTILPGQSLAVGWVDLQDVTSPADDLRMQGASKGAAMFSRGEGIWAAPGAVYFAATSGGAIGAGQIWRYRPSPAEGTPGEATQRGTLELFLEPNDTDVLENADNLTVAPWGDLIVCEDGPNGNYVRGVTPVGQPYTFARNAMNDSEFAGATFSPDGTTLFLNIQRPGLTLAVTGPWPR